MMRYDIEHYLTAKVEKDSYLDWLSRLRDRCGKIAIIRRVARIEHGNFGDHKFCREGVWALRVDEGPGYRVYYALSGPKLVLLLGGGDKRSQDKDIERAVEYWQDWQCRGEI